MIYITLRQFSSEIFKKLMKKLNLVKGKRCDINLLAPLYLRRSEAEERLEGNVDFYAGFCVPMRRMINLLFCCRIVLRNISGIHLF